MATTAIAALGRHRKRPFGAICSGLLVLLAVFAPPVMGGTVEISGVERNVLKSLEAGISIGRLAKDAPVRLVRRRHAQAGKEIRRGLRAFGYYRPKVIPRLELEDDGTWRALYQIEPGPRWRWKAAVLTTQPMTEDPWQANSQDIARRLENTDVDHRDYKALKNQFLESAFAAGYLDARYLQSRLEVDLDGMWAQPRLNLELGPRYRFGQVTIEQDILDADFLNQFNPIVQGRLFSADEVLQLRLRLADLGYFSDIEIDNERDPEAALVALRVVATPRRPQRWQIGAGYGTDTGPRVLGSVEFRYLNRRGHKLEAEARLSEVKIDLSARYVLPTGPEPGANWSIRSQRREEKLGDTETTTLLNGLSRNRIVGPRRWHYYLNYEFERFAFSADDRRTDLVTPGVSLSLRQSDDLLLPRRGHTLFLDLHGAHDSLLSSTSFLQARIEGRFITSISSRSRLLLRGQLGANWLDEAADLPASQRFFAGGDNSIRGYDYRRIAPRNEADEIVGGRFLQTASIEFDRLVWRNYGAAVFYDLGSASNSFAKNLVHGVGAGFRWATPVGMLRVDVAHPLDDPDTRFSLHIGIGGEL